MDYNSLNHVKGVVDGHQAEMLRQAEGIRLLNQPKQQNGHRPSGSVGKFSLALPQVGKVYWWVPAGFAAMVLLRSIIGV